MSALQQKAIAQKQYTALVSKMGFKLPGVNTHKMNASQILKACNILSSMAPKKTQKFQPRHVLWKQLKNANLDNGLTYKFATAEDMTAKLAKYTNPINGRILDDRGVKLFNNLGYQFKGNKWFVPKSATQLVAVDTPNGKVYPISSKDAKSHNAAVVSYYTFDPTTGIQGQEESLSFKVNARDSATNAINALIYSNYDKYGDNTETIITSVELFKAPKSFKYGPAYDGSVNCVITALEQYLHKKLPDLHERYEQGVGPNDYEDIAKAIDKTIRVNVNGQLMRFNTSRKQKTIDLKYLNNHVVANWTKEERTVIKHEKLDDNTINKIFENDSVKEITSVMRIGDTVIGIDTLTHRYQLNQQEIKHADKKSDFIPINSDSLTATSEFKRLVIEKNKLGYVIGEDADHYCRHGIKILEAEFKEGNTIDLRGAYTNYMNWPCYEGIPFDITFKCNGNQTPAERDVILQKYLGFALVSNWENYFTGNMETRWVSIPHIKSRLAKGMNSFKVERWHLAFAKGDLNLSMFEGMPKRLWHLVIGSMSRTKNIESFATTDELLANSQNAHKWKRINNIDVYIGTKDSNYCKSYAHVSATIQSYSEIMLEDKFDQMRGINWWAIYVDGISTTTTDLSKYEDEFWASKPNKRFCGSGGSDTSYIEAPIMSKDLSDEMQIALSKIYIEDQDDFDEYLQIEKEYWAKHSAIWEDRNFVDILVSGSNQYKFIDGPAGSGKSTLIKKIAKMCNTIILTPNNNQKKTFDGFKCETIDMYLTKSLTDPSIKRSFCIIDEYTHMSPNKLKSFERALFFGNVEQLKIGEYLDYKDYDYHLLDRIYRYDETLAVAASDAKKGIHNAIAKIDVKEALKNGYTILAPTHRIIESINEIGLSLNIPRIIRFTTTDLKKDIFAGDMGEIKNGLCYNNRNGKSYKMKIGRDPKKDQVVYGYARTYHSTQGLEFDKIVCCIRRMTNWDMLYTGITRVHKIEDAYILVL